VIVPAGAYREEHHKLETGGYYVRLYRVTGAVHVRGRLPSSARRVRRGRLPSSARRVRRARSATATASVAGSRSVKGRGWWCHPLFGNPDGLPPPCVSKTLLRRWEADWYLRAEKRREADFYGGSAA
jgi:hypothetical protein